MKTTFGPEGEIRSTDILAALVALWREGASGTLQFSRSGATSGFELAAGEIAGASSSDPRFDTASILVRAGKLEASTLERLVASEGADRALAALQAGVLTKREWRWGEKIRAVEVLSDLLTWIEGDYSLFRTGPREAGEFRLTIPRLILELFLRSRDRGLVLHHLGGADVPLVRDSRFDAEFATFGLTDDAESVVRLIDGESTAADIAAEAPAEAFAVEKLLAALVTLGLVHPAYAVEEPGAAPPTLSPAPPAEREDEADVPAREEEDEDEELEPEVDIDDKVEVAPPVPAPEYDALEDEADAPPESDETLVDADLGGSPDLRDEPSDEDSEGARLAADLERTQAAPDDFGGDVEVAGTDAADSSSESVYTPLEFQRPLDVSTGVGHLERPRHRSSAALLTVLVLLVAATAAVLYWRARGPETPGEPLPVAATSPSPTARETSVETPVPRAALPQPTAGAALPAATPAPTAARPTPPRPRPTARAARPAPTAAPRVPAASGRPQSRQGWVERAERDEKSADSDREARFSVQLELACEVPSLTEAFAHDRPAGTMWVVKTSFRGRTCFRVLWGRYPSREAAETGLSGAPAFFSTPRNHPMVVAIR
jgi:hypothetical protein